MFTAALLLSAAAAAPTTAPTAKPMSLAEDVADISTRICYGLVSGAVVIPPVSKPEDLAAQEKAVTALGLTNGIDGDVFSAMGPAGGALLSQATMASRKNGAARVIFAVGGRNPGCRAIVVAEPDAALTDAVTVALTAPKGGWKAIPSMTATRGVVERRAFIRRDAAGKPYLLNLMTVTDTTAKLRLFTTTAAIPDGVTIPAGY